MYATVHQFRRSVAAESPGWGAALARDLHGSAPAGSCTLAQLAGLEGSVVAWWPTAEAAAGAAARRTPTGPTWLDAAAYEVVDDHAGSAADRPPRVAQLTCFDGPRSAAEVAAADHAGRDRLWPAVRDVPGLVSVSVLREADGGTIVLALATDVATHEAVQRAVFGTELLPDEDPALLRDPDRVQLATVVDVRLPVPAAGASS
ncbi:hypothetical protein [Modestobacter versicolor]|uniref:hypothetical protein n=1 Tax=Modestobacter versicolor TaxID=429133 RepID=UPI0034DE2EBA